MTAPAVQPPPRERAPAQYQELNEQRYRSQVDEELAQKHDKRSNLRLGRGKSLILSAPGGLEFALALDNDGFITVTNYSTGDVGELTVRFDNVEGLAQEFIDVRAEFAAADGSLSSAYIAADAVVAADAASANASLSTTLTAAYQAADSTVASNAAALVTSEASTRAAADTAIASDVTALTARVTTAEGDINTVEATAAAIDGRLVTVEGSYATASSVSSLTATVNTKARTFSQTSAPTATATGDLWIDTDDNNRLYRWSGTAWVEVTDPRIASSASTLTTVTADITTLETAVADLDATKAEASTVSSLSATVSTIQSDLTAAEADIVTALANAATAQATADGKIQTFYQTSAPTAEGVGDLWFDTDDGNKQYRWSGSAWVDAQDTAIGDAISAAAGAQATADGKITSFYQTSAPTAEGVGDLWIDTDDNNKLYRWSGSAWVAADDARIATNAAAITTESSARASGDSANATLITNLTAEVVSLRTQVLPDRPAIASDFTSLLGSGTPSTFAALSTGTVVNVANEGDVRQFTDNTPLGHRGWLPVISGNTYRSQFRVRVTVDGTGNQLYAQFVLYSSSGVALASFGTTTVDASFVAADGWVNGEITGTGAAMLAAQATAAFVRARVYGGRNSGGTHSGATWQVAYHRLEDITEIEALEASVTTTASAVADIEGRLAASYAIQVDGGGNGALVSLEDGTELGSVVKLAADKIELAAEAINFGDDTVYEDTHNTFYTVGGAYRYRDRGPFGASSDLLVWYGLNSVALNSETKTNGIFAIATDGKTYFGTSPLDDVTAPLEISFSPASWDSSHTAAGTLNQAVEATVTGGSGTYTYFWSVADVIQGGRPTLTNTTTDTVTVNRSYLTVATIEGTISVEVRDTVTGKSARRFWGYLDVYDDGGGGGGSGGALPP